MADEVMSYRHKLVGWTTYSPFTSYDREAHTGLLMRLALATAVLSVIFQKYPSIFKYFESNAYLYGPLFLIAGIAIPFLLHEKYSRIALIPIASLMIVSAFSNWQNTANHSWLAVWTVPIALLVPQWWKSELFPHYVRLTLGVVMIAAFAQKLVAGTYLDGSYIAYLSHYGSTTENMFGFLCSKETLETPCFMHRAIGKFIMGWQLAVGVLLILGFKSLIFLAVEVGFLLGAGVYADEMNFQVLNIALLCIAFRVGMFPILFLICAALLVVDVYGVGELFLYVIGS